MYRSIELNGHSEYLKLLDFLEKTAKYIEYVVIDDDDTRLIDFLRDDVYERKNVDEWWGTKSRSRSLYKIKSSPKLFKYLKRFSTFCVCKKENGVYKVEICDFGINDIAFFDDRAEPLLFTTTHEGYIGLRDDVKY